MPDPNLPKTLPDGLTADMILEAATEDDNIGYCLKCGAERPCTEPDATYYDCEDCGENMVFGASELLLMGYGG